MTKKLQHIFALSEKGAKDLVKAVIWCFVCNLALMFPVGAVLFTVQHLLSCLEDGSSPMDGFWIYVGFALAVLLLLFVLHWFQYASLYIATYRESANRRVSLAETLRRLPLSFFGNRDLSDLTSTMIADCSSLDQMFSHYVPQLFASIGSTLIIGVCMFLCDWRMALVSHIEIFHSLSDKLLHCANKFRVDAFWRLPVADEKTNLISHISPSTR